MSDIRIFCDLDGVLANLSKKMYELLEVEYPAYEYIEYHHLVNLVGSKRFFSIFYQKTFWEGLEPFPYANDLVDALKSTGKPVYFLTRAVNSPHCFAGKYKWGKAHFPEIPLIICPPGINKSIFCRPGDYLIDDQKSNLIDWWKSGGEEFHWEEIGDQFDKEHVRHRILTLKKEISNLS